jgi:hypothetical protein
MSPNRVKSLQSTHAIHFFNDSFSVRMNFSFNPWLFGDIIEQVKQIQYEK